MSLRAKIEAVIYAAEEPVTLAQLSAVFAAEVPDEAPPPSETSDSRPNARPSALSLIEEGFLKGSNFGFDADMAEAELLRGAAQRERAEHARTHAAPSIAATEAASDTREEAEKSDDPGAEAKRAAKQREREVREHLKQIVDSLIAEYAGSDRGMEIREVAGGYRIATKPEYHDAVRAFVKSLKPPMKLSLQALETLAVIAYKQPVTAPEVAEIRGVDSGGVLGSLVGRKLITTAGRKQVIGRPILYKTTREFLLRFGLKDLNELPSIEEFEKLAGDIDIGEDEAAPEEGNLPFEAEEVTEDSLPAVGANAGEANAGEPGMAVESAAETARESDTVKDAKPAAITLDASPAIEVGAPFSTTAPSSAKADGTEGSEEGPAKESVQRGERLAGEDHD